MTTLNERAQKGSEIRARFGGGTPSKGSVPGSRAMAPDLHRIADEALFGSIWQRPGLKIEHREMIVLSVLTVLQRENQLHRHVANAFNLGLSSQQIIEVMIHASFYGGVPAAFTSMGVAEAVFKANNIPFEPLLVYDPNETPDGLYQKGISRRLEYMGESSTSGDTNHGPVTQAEREFNRLTTEYYWGSVWTRLPSCCGSTMAPTARRPAAWPSTSSKTCARRWPIWRAWRLCCLTWCAPAIRGRGMFRVR